MLPRVFVPRMNFDLSKGGISKFEEALSEYFDRKALLTPSGRVGLKLILKAYGIRKRDKVLLSSFNASSVVKVVEEVATPVFIEVDERTMNVVPKDIEREEGKALIVLHTEGNPCYMKKIKKIAEEKGFLLVEDCAHALGSSIHGKKTGTFGDAAILSFGMGKMINTAGGGAVLVEDESVGKKIRKELRRYPKPSLFNTFFKYLKNNAFHVMSKRTVFSTFVGPFLRFGDILSLLFEDRGIKPMLMHDLQGNAGVLQLERLEGKIEARRRKARKIMKGLEEFFPKYIGKPNFHNLCFFSGDKEPFRKHMLSYGIDVQKTWLKGYSDTARKLSESVCYLPIHEGVNEEDVKKMKEAIQDYTGNLG
ncbi:hypothetical protein DRN62_01060 [Nanoarchaeota archaeon]|nr:MAG: hypothetical protein DRN62_01060 [Nanoarchaeota archaeon]